MTITEDRKVIDDQVYGLIAAGEVTYASGLCVRLGYTDHEGPCSFRVVDRSLQRLRRAGRIVYDKHKRRWKTVSEYTLD